MKYQSLKNLTQINLNFDLAWKPKYLDIPYKN